jgi:hypothetical protein
MRDLLWSYDFGSQSTVMLVENLLCNAMELVKKPVSELQGPIGIARRNDAQKHC